MSDTDSFIEEVSEEVRRDQLFKLIKKYGWIAILLVVLLVGGAAYNEFRKSRERAAAEAFGDSVLGALQENDATARSAALSAVSADGDRAAILALIAASEQGDPAAITQLREIAKNPNAPTIYRHLAELKLLMQQASELSADERLSRLQDLATAGAPFRLIAEEQIALVHVQTGNVDSALEQLQAILADGEVTAGLRRRVSQLIVALGGQLEPA